MKPSDQIISRTRVKQNLYLFLWATGAQRYRVRIERQSCGLKTKDFPATADGFLQAQELLKEWNHRYPVAKRGMYDRSKPGGITVVEKNIYLHTAPYDEKRKYQMYVVRIYVKGSQIQKYFPYTEEGLEEARKFKLKALARRRPTKRTHYAGKWSFDMDAAPKDDRLILVATKSNPSLGEDLDNQHRIHIAYWEEATEFFPAGWRTTSEGPNEIEPVAWAKLPLPPIDPSERK